MYNYVWVWEREKDREKESEREGGRKGESKINLKKKLSNNLNIFTKFILSQTFHTFQRTWTLITFVYLCLSLFKWRIYANILCLFIAESFSTFKIRRFEKNPSYFDHDIGVLIYKEKKYGHNFRFIFFNKKTL